MSEPALAVAWEGPGAAAGALPLLAEVLAYPGPDLVVVAERCRAALAPAYPAAAAGVEAFLDWAAGADPSEREELYTRTFDLHPPHCLEVGYQLFGESYKRGAFLVKVGAAVQALGVERGSDLSDHLAVLLRLLPRLEPGPARDLVDEAVLPALARVVAAFAGTGEAQLPYRRLLEGTLAVLQAAYAVETIRPVPQELQAPSPALFTLGTPPPANRHDEPASGGPRR